MSSPLETVDVIVRGVGVVIQGGLLALVAVMRADLRDVKDRVVRLENTMLGAPPRKPNSQHAHTRIHTPPQ